MDIDCKRWNKGCTECSRKFIGGDASCAEKEGCVESVFTGNAKESCVDFFVSEEEKRECHVWFDGCNLCTHNKPNLPLSCTKRKCEVKKRPMCRSELPQFNCFTREAWTDEKRNWCCMNRKRGCSGKNPELEYAEEKADCQVWFDGCNNCGRPNADAEFSCGSAFCAVFIDPYCKKRFKAAYEREYDCSKRNPWPAKKAQFCCRERDVGCPATCKSDYDCFKGKVCSKGITGNYCMSKTDNVRGSQMIRVIDDPTMEEVDSTPGNILGLMFVAGVLCLGYLYYKNASKAQGKGQ